MFVVTLKFVNETDKNEAIQCLEDAEADGYIMNAFDTHVEEVED